MNKNNKKGFTLIELSIALIIMAILVIGIIYASILIKTAKVVSFIAEVKEYRVATATFYEKYSELPGDSKIIVSYVPSKLTENDAGNNDGIIGIKNTSTPWLSKESYEFFKHLWVAGMIAFESKAPGNGNDLPSLSSITIGETYPGTKLNKAYFFYIDSGDIYGLFVSKNRLSIYNNDEQVRGISGDLLKILDKKLDEETIFSGFSINDK